jgi:hypothetical protein
MHPVQWIPNDSFQDPQTLVWTLVETASNPTIGALEVKHYGPVRTQTFSDGDFAQLTIALVYQGQNYTDETTALDAWVAWEPEPPPE